MRQHILAAIRRILPKGQFARSVAVLGGGTAVASAIGVLASPVITRLYDPADFGALGVYVAITSILTVITSLRYSQAIQVPKEEQVATDLLRLSLYLVVVTSLLLGGAIWHFAAMLCEQFKVPELSRYLWLAPLTLLTSGIYDTLQMWAIRRKGYTIIAQTKMWQGLFSVTTQIGLGFLIKGPLGLIIGNTVQQGAGSTSLARLLRSTTEKQQSVLSINRLLQAANRYRQFPLYSTWAAMLNACSNQIPSMLIANTFGGIPVGLYNLTSQVLAMPARLVGNSIAQVFISSIREARDRGDTSQETRKIYHRLLMITVPFALIIACAGPELFAFVFGQEWRVAGRYAQWLTPWMVLDFVSNPLSALVIVLEKQRSELVFQIVFFLTRLSALAAGCYLGNSDTAVILFGMTSALMRLYYISWIMHLSKNPRSLILSELTDRVLRSLPLTLPTVIGTFLVTGGAATLVGSMLSFGLIGITLVRSSKRRDI